MALQAQALVERLHHDGVEVELLATNPPIPRLVARVKGLRTVVQTGLFLLKLVGALRRRRIIHLLAASHWYFVLRVAPTVILGKCFGRRLILNYRGGEAPRFFARFRSVVLPVLRLVDEIAVPSTYLQRLFVSFGFSPAIIPNFVDLERFRFRQRDRIQPKLLVTRSLEPLYNVKMALEAFAIIKKKHADARIDVVGSGSEEGALKRWVDQRGLAQIYFHGAVPNEEIPNYLDAADILLNPSNADNMPINLLEAFAAGVAVVSTDVGGIPDLVGSDKAALLVSPNDAADMAARVEELLQQPETVARLTTHAKGLCDQTKWAAVGRLWLALYNNQGCERAAKSAATTNETIV